MDRKHMFYSAIQVLREYTNWEINLYRCGVDIEDTAASHLADEMLKVLVDYNYEWDYDPIEEFGWIMEYCSNCNFDSIYNNYQRAGRTWNLADAMTLYDFLVYMNEHNWER